MSRDCVVNSHLPCKVSVVVGPGKGHCDHSPAHTRSVQHSDRLRVETGERSVRLVAGTQSVPDNQPNIWSIGGGLVCLSSHSPTTEVVDAFQQDWRRVKGYANPPWCLIGCVLNKIRTQEAQVMLVAPAWKGQAWYPVLLVVMLRDYPHLIPPQESLVQREGVQRISEITPQLAMWLVLGRDTESASFLLKLRTSCSPPVERSPHSHTNPTLASGPAGVRNGVMIPFQDL